jgi:hypothetical protein
MAGHAGLMVQGTNFFMNEGGGDGPLSKENNQV